MASELSEEFGIPAGPIAAIVSSTMLSDNAKNIAFGELINKSQSLDPATADYSKIVSDIMKPLALTPEQRASRTSQIKALTRNPAFTEDARSKLAQDLYNTSQTGADISDIDPAVVKYQLAMQGDVVPGTDLKGLLSPTEISSVRGALDRQGVSEADLVSGGVSVGDLPGMIQGLVTHGATQDPEAMKDISSRVQKAQRYELLFPEKAQHAGSTVDVGRLLDKAGITNETAKTLIQLSPLDDVLNPGEGLMLSTAFKGAGKAYGAAKNLLPKGTPSVPGKDAYRKASQRLASRAPVAQAASKSKGLLSKALAPVSKVLSPAGKALAPVSKVIKGIDKRLPQLALAEQAYHGVKAYTDPTARQARLDAAQSDNMTKTVVDAATGKGLANIATAAVEGGDLAADFNADVLLGKVSPSEWLAEYKSGSNVAGKEFAQSPMGRQVFGIPSPQEEAETKAYHKQVRDISARSGKILRDFDERKANADRPLALGGIIQDYHSQSYPDKVTPKTLAQSAAALEHMRKKVGPYAAYYQDLVAAKGQQSPRLTPRTLGEFTQMKKAIGKHSPGVDFFKKTKAKNFAEVMQELNKTKQDSPLGIKNLMAQAKSTANNRTPQKMSGTVK